MPKRAVERLRSEFLEMPGLRLTASQIQRLCGIDAEICNTALELLVGEHFLSAKPDGMYVRLTEGRVARSRASNVARDDADTLERA
jgi:hypothetical protein